MPHTSLEPRLAEALLALSCAVEQIRATVSRSLGLTPQQAQLLGLVAERGFTHGELAGRLDCDKTNITGLVNRLERRELIKRRPDPNDRRASRVFLSDQGAQLVSELRTGLTAALADRMSSCPPTHRDQLATLAHSTTEALRSAPRLDSSRELSAPEQ